MTFTSDEADALRLSTFLRIIATPQRDHRKHGANTGKRVARARAARSALEPPFSARIEGFLAPAHVPGIPPSLCNWITQTSRRSLLVSPIPCLIAPTRKGSHHNLKMITPSHRCAHKGSHHKHDHPSLPLRAQGITSQR